MVRVVSANIVLNYQPMPLLIQQAHDIKRTSYRCWCEITLHQRQGEWVNELRFNIPLTTGWHTEMGPWIKVSSEKPEKQDITFAHQHGIICLVGSITSYLAQTNSLSKLSCTGRPSFPLTLHGQPFFPSYLAWTAPHSQLLCTDRSSFPVIMHK